MLVGPSGGGKTTALKMVNRLIAFDEGDIRIDGRSVRELPVVELRRGIGYVIQQVGLFPHMTIGENIATVPRLLGWAKARIRARVAELLELVGLEQSDAERYPAQLSGGQRQRVGLARALAADPPVLLMDEPFGALDPITRARLQQEVRRLHREVAKTVIFVTHDIDEAITMGDRIAILREGGVLAQYDTPDAILAHPADDFVERVHRRGPRAAPARAAPASATSRSATSRDSPRTRPAWPSTATVRNAVSLMLETGADAAARRRRRRRAARRRSRSSAATRAPAASDRRRPRHPELRPRELVRHGRPRLLLGLGARSTGATRSSRASSQHVELTLIAVVDRLRARLRARAARAPRARRRPADRDRRRR